MPDAMKQSMENIKALTPHERALLAHCLISSLDKIQEENVDDAWFQLAEKRWAELDLEKQKPSLGKKSKKASKFRHGKHVFHPEVQKEVLVSYRWYEEQSQGLGDDFIRELETSYQTILEFPHTCLFLKKGSDVFF